VTRIRRSFGSIEAKRVVILLLSLEPT
jgi:hypothetical protein